MPTFSFRELERVLKKMGFDEHPKKKGTAWVGISPINSSLVTIIIHKHAGGRSIPNGLMNNYIKNLGFNDYSEFQKWIDNK